MDHLRRARRLVLRGPGLGDVHVERPAQCDEDVEWLGALVPTVLATAGDHRLVVRLAAAFLAATASTGASGTQQSAAARRVQEALVAHLSGPRRSDSASAESLACVIRAVTDDDVQAFVDAVDDLLGAPVTLLDVHNETVATSRSEYRNLATSGRSRTMLVEADGEVAGSLKLPAAGWWSAGEEEVLRHLALLLLQRRRLVDEIRDVRHRAALSDWLATEIPPAAGPVGAVGQPRPPCRPVVISLPDRVEGLPARTLGERVRRACAAHPELRTVTLVPGDTGLLGVYSDEGATEPHAQARAWQEVLDGLAVPGLAVSVGPRASAGDELRASYAAVRAVAHLQRRNAGYLGLPVVAVSEELGPIADVLTAVSAGQIPFFVERVLGDLLTDSRFGGQLMETLYAYLMTCGSPQESGRLLHLHASSVKYRMRVMRQLLGARLDDPAQRFDLELAVRLYLAAQQFAGATKEHA